MNKETEEELARLFYSQGAVTEEVTTELLSDSLHFAAARKFYKGIYKSTEAGVCIHMRINNNWHAGDELPQIVPIRTIEALMISSIVEGSEAEFGGYIFEIDKDFSANKFMHEVASVNEQAVSHWHEVHDGEYNSVANF